MTVPSQEDEPAKIGGRWQGVLLLGFAAVTSYFSIVLPLQEAYVHAPKIEWGAEFSFLSPPMALLGILAILFPSMTTNDTFLLKTRDKLSLAGWVVLAALLAFGAGSYYLVNNQLESLGYVDDTQTPVSK